MRRLAILALLASLAGAGCSSSNATPEPTSPGASSRTSAPVTHASAPAPGADGQCRSDITPRPLPTWARAGFTPPTLPTSYVLGDEGNIVAILWVEHDPLSAPPRKDRTNKILWVSRTTSPVPAPLQIRATLIGSGRSVNREVVNGPGPSIIDMPSAGCWSFDLTWGEHHDHLDLRYAVG